MRKGTVSIIIGLLLIAAALCIAAYNFYDSYRAGSSVEAVLEKLEPELRGTPVHPVDPDSPDEIYADYVLNPNMSMPVKTVDGIDYIGVLRVPNLGLEVPVIGNWSYSLLEVSACRYSGSVYLHNMVLCGHNYMGLFGSIGRLSIGDRVTFTDIDGNEFFYEISEIEGVIPEAVQVMTSGNWDLTLFTCTAGAQARIAVRCMQVSADDNEKEAASKP